MKQNSFVLINVCICVFCTDLHKQRLNALYNLRNVNFKMLIYMKICFILIKKNIFFCL